MYQVLHWCPKLLLPETSALVSGWLSDTQLVLRLLWSTGAMVIRTEIQMKRCPKTWSGGTVETLPFYDHCQHSNKLMIWFSHSQVWVRVAHQKSGHPLCWDSQACRPPGKAMSYQETKQVRVGERRAGLGVTPKFTPRWTVYNSRRSC
jgi:hypothetical protein